MATPMRRLRTATAAARGAANREEAPAAPVRINPNKKAVQDVPGKGHVSTSYSRSKTVIDETHRDAETAPRRFEPGEEVAYVRIGAGCTINMDKFESLRIDVAITLPCLPEEVNATADEASQFVLDRMTEEQVRWLGEGNQRF